DPGIVDQHVEAPVPLVDGRDRLPHLLGVRDVAGERQVGEGLLAQILERGRVEIEGDHARTLVPEGLRDGAADPPARTGDEHDAPGQVDLHASPRTVGAAAVRRSTLGRTRRSGSTTTASLLLGAGSRSQEGTAMQARTVWVTGAGPGMGRASALAAAPEGRRAQRLEEVAAQIRADGGTALVVPLDVTDRDAVRSAAGRIEAELGDIEALVLSAGLNAPRRSWRDQDLDEFAAITETNLLAPVAVIDAALPGMRERGAGTVVLISSYAAWRFSPDAGTAYSASKTALGPLASMLNAQENRHGIRACRLCPGDVDSDVLDQRPVGPGAADRAVMLIPEDVGRAVSFVLTSPAHVVVDELVISPAKPEV